MKLLLITHAFIGWDSNPDKLSPRALTLCQDRRNTLIVSVASLWEMQIKSQLGKLKFNIPMAELIKNQKETNAIKVLTISLEHILELGNLPTIHNDPFDRLLIAQAKVENAMIVSTDSIFAQYPVTVVWSNLSTCSPQIQVRSSL